MRDKKWDFYSNDYFVKPWLSMLQSQEDTELDADNVSMETFGDHLGLVIVIYHIFH